MSNIMLDRIYMGNSEADKIYLGNELLYQKQMIFPKNEAPNGVYILTTDNHCVRREGYTTSGKTGMGIAIIQNNFRLVVAYEIIKEVAWSPLSLSHESIGYYNSYQEALTVTGVQGKEMNDTLNALAWFNTSINAKAKEYSKGTLGIGKWYVPTLSQLYNITINNWEEVMKIFVLFGTSYTAYTNHFWTIIQQSTDSAYAIQMLWSDTDHSIVIPKKNLTQYSSNKTMCLLPVADL